VAEQKLPKVYHDRKKLAWLSLDSQEGQEYWLAMNLMGEYAAANHAVIHRNVLERAGANPLAVIENHHNFAWKEQHSERELIVHRKGATPAGAGVLGVIPGSMADTCFVVRGKGKVESLASAAHGAGRCMSRTEARKKFSWKQWKPILERRGIRLLAGGLDEVPGVYKDIRTVMAAQKDLVEIVATFDPKVVLMCSDGSRAED
jgi:tRNA-splicing ligase RtcB